MDSLQHTCYGVALGIHFQLPAEQVAVVAVVAVAPDAIGWLEKIIKKDPNAWGWYVVAHEKETIGYTAIAAIALTLASIALSPSYLTILPVLCWGGWLLHVLPDMVLHREGWRWWADWKGIVCEVFGWILLIAYAYHTYA